jgi:hypothetical protein
MVVEDANTLRRRVESWRESIDPDRFDDDDLWPTLATAMALRNARDGFENESEFTAWLRAQRILFVPDPALDHIHQHNMTLEQQTLYAGSAKMLDAQLLGQLQTIASAPNAFWYACGLKRRNKSLAALVKAIVAASRDEPKLAIDVIPKKLQELASQTDGIASEDVWVALAVLAEVRDALARLGGNN